MGDGLLTVPFIPPLATALAPTPWSIFSLLLSSSYSGWGTRSLGDDCDEIAKCIRYIREHKQSTRPASFQSADGDGKIVLMGHSTGSQDVLHYLVYDLFISPAVDGAILQAPVSDREGMAIELDGADEETHSLFSDATRYAREIHDSDADPELKTLIPLKMTRPFYGDTPITTERWLSLQMKGYEELLFVDDLFSSDVEGRQLFETFGSIHKKVHLCVLYSGSDEHVPGWVDKTSLLARWRGAVENGVLGKAVWDGENGGVIMGARHALNGDGQEGQRKELVQRVMGLLKKVESDGS
jgi:hypothetical protein